MLIACIWRRRGHRFESHFERFCHRNACACVPKSISPWFPRHWNEAGRSAYDRTRYTVPTPRRFRRSEGWYKDYPGLGNRSAFYPHSWVGNTFTSVRPSTFHLPWTNGCGIHGRPRRTRMYHADCCTTRSNNQVPKMLAIWAATLSMIASNYGSFRVPFLSSLPASF